MIRIFHQYISAKSVLLLALEGVLIVLALVAAVRLRFWNDPLEFDFHTAWPDFAAQTAIVVLVFQICFYYNDLYDLNAVRHSGEQLVRLGQSLGAACLLLGFIYFVAPALLIGRGVFAITVLLVVVSVMAARAVVDLTWRVATPAKRVLILGTGSLAASVARELNRRRDLNLEVVPGMGNVSSGPEIEALARQQRVSRIIVAHKDSRGALPVQALVRLRLEGVEIEEARVALAALTGRVALETLRPSWLVFSPGFRCSPLTALLKRLFDLCLSATGLVVSAPAMALVSLAVWIESGRPILYQQERIGLRGKPFRLLKFRSMRPDAENGNGAQWAQENDPRVTRVGRWLRKFRLDELPQFWNVLRGEMSLVGPRPERPEFVNQLRETIPYYDERHSVRPGITGWAQVRYPYGASVEDAARKLEYDLFYLKNLSVLFDCAIVFETVKIVLFGRGGR
jgi:sugar transferase (PEP-CTERM system associated)